MILDHENGNSNDNQAKNLRYLCPNCDAQLPTRGGRNKGRITNESAGGFQINHKDGKLDTHIFTKPDSLNLTGHKPKAVLKGAKRNS